MRQISQSSSESTPDAASGIGAGPAAARIRRALGLARVLGVRIIGHPGSGKTDLIQATLRMLPAPKRAIVVVVNPAAGRDAKRLAPLCGHVEAIEAAVPEAGAIWRAISKVRLDEFDTLFIEAAGGLAPLKDLGQDATAAVFAISSGDDKAVVYQSLLASASAVLLTKTDLRPLVRFDGRVFREDVRAINSFAEVIELSATAGWGMAEWVRWIENRRAAKMRSWSRGDARDWSSEGFIG